MYCARMQDSSMTSAEICDDLRALGIDAGDVLIVHASLKSLGPLADGPETVVQGLLRALGQEGTLLMPALSHLQEPFDFHDNLRTPGNVGALPEYFRKRRGTVRSLHPTHSVCGVGSRVDALFADHIHDDTPCGLNSPFNRITEIGGKILMLGCGLKPNTTMHALEEHVEPPYLFGETVVYTIIDGDDQVFEKEYRTHGFMGVEQRYDRIRELPDPSFMRSGKVLQAEAFVLDAAAMRGQVLAQLKDDPTFLVD